MFEDQNHEPKAHGLLGSSDPCLMCFWVMDYPEQASQGTGEATWILSPQNPSMMSWPGSSPTSPPSAGQMCESPVQCQHPDTVAPSEHCHGVGITRQTERFPKPSLRSAVPTDLGNTWPTSVRSRKGKFGAVLRTSCRGHMEAQQR